MSDFVSFNPTEIEKLGFICSTCGTEVIIGLMQPAARDLRFPQRCPTCNSTPLFAFSSGGWDWLAKIRQMAAFDEAPRVRLYFKPRD